MCFLAWRCFQVISAPSGLIILRNDKAFGSLSLCSMNSELEKESDCPSAWAKPSVSPRSTLPPKEAQVVSEAQILLNEQKKYTMFLERKTVFSVHKLSVNVTCKLNTILLQIPLESLAT